VVHAKSATCRQQRTRYRLGESLARALTLLATVGGTDIRHRFCAYVCTSRSIGNQALTEDKSR
jgi:hypothetical protein